MKENIIPVMLGGAPEPNPPGLTLTPPHSGAALTHDSVLLLPSLLGDFFNVLALSNAVSPSGVLQGEDVFWALLDLGSQSHVLPLKWDMGMCHLIPIQSLSY